MNLKLGFLLFVNSLVLLLIANTLSISFLESELFFHSNSPLAHIVRVATSLFGQNDIALRLPMIVFHLLSVYLLYEVSKPMLENPRERLYMVSVYSLLPGVISASLAVNMAGVVIFLTLFYLFVREKNEIYSYFVLAFVLFVDPAFAMLYLALFIYALYEKRSYFALSMFVLFILSMTLLGFETHGKPKTYFLDTFAVYSAIFSPLLFIYLFYTLYRMLIKEKKNLLFFIAITSLGFTLLLSFRQRVPIESFAPFLVISMPLVAQMFLRSYRVRLKEHRSSYRRFLSVTVGVLLLSSLSMIFNPLWYLFLKNPNKHFVRKNHIAKELSVELKKLGISSVSSNDKEMLQRLKYYGIDTKGSYILSNDELVNSKKITIVYMGVEVGEYYILMI